MISYRKIGGLHWFTLGRLRIAWCIRRPASGASRLPNVNKAWPLKERTS